MALDREMENAEFEYIFIDDGSKDKTLSVVKKLSEDHFNTKYISFSRNFGKEAAIFSGLKYSTGDYVAIIDADMQDPPRLIKEMHASILNEGYDCVATRRTTRKGEPPVRSFFSRLFYRFVNKLSKTEFVDGARDFRLMSRQMVDAILQISEYNRFSKGIFSWVGFKTKWIEYENVERIAGKTKWSFWGLLAYSFEGIVGFSTVPLTIAFVLGIVFCVLSFLAIIFIIARQLIFGGSAFGWPSLVCVIFFLSGIQLFCMGIIGQYMAKTYLETKKRPIFLVRETNISEI